MMLEINKPCYSSLLPLIYDRESSANQWKRIKCEWKEKAPNLTHVVACTINAQTTDLYLDCRERKIWAKCVALTFIRPLHTIILKTVYHILLPISLPLEIASRYLTARKYNLSIQKTICLCVVKVFYSLQDIFRSPLYGTILTIISLSGVLIGPIAPEKLYDIRELYSKVESSLNDGKQISAWRLAPCFLPFTNLRRVKRDLRKFDATEYYKNEFMDGLANRARAIVKLYRTLAHRL